MPPLATQWGFDPEPTRDWEVYSIWNGPARLIGWAQAASADLPGSCQGIQQRREASNCHSAAVMTFGGLLQTLY
jgi:hypothetical protein